jgi:BMFP domain-containing protein YqiC
LQVVELPRPDDCSDHFHRFGIVIRWIARSSRAYAPYGPLFGPVIEVQVPCQPRQARCGARIRSAPWSVPKIGAWTGTARQNGAGCLGFVRRRPVEMPRVEELLRNLMQGLPPGLMSGASGLREDLENNFRAVLRANLGKLDLAGRDEFDAQRKVLERTRARLEELERRVADLEARASGPSGR